MHVILLCTGLLLHCSVPQVYAAVITHNQKPTPEQPVSNPPPPAAGGQSGSPQEDALKAKQTYDKVVNDASAKLNNDFLTSKGELENFGRQKTNEIQREALKYATDLRKLDATIIAAQIQKDQAPQGSRQKRAANDLEELKKERQEMARNNWSRLSDLVMKNRNAFMEKAKTEGDKLDKSMEAANKKIADAQKNVQQAVQKVADADNNDENKQMNEQQKVIMEQRKKTMEMMQKNQQPPQQNQQAPQKSQPMPQQNQQPPQQNQQPPQ